MIVYLVTFYDGNTAMDEATHWIEPTEKKAEERVGKAMRTFLYEVRNPETQKEIRALVDKGEIDKAYTLFVEDGGRTGMLGISVRKMTVGK